MVTRPEHDAPLLTRRDAARYLAISIRKLDQLAAQGLLPRVRFGASVRFAVRDLDYAISLAKEGGLQ